MEFFTNSDSNVANRSCSKKCVPHVVRYAAEGEIIGFMNINYHDLPKLSYTRFTPGGLVETKAVDTEVQLVAYEAELAGIRWEAIPDSELVKFSYRGHDEYLLGHIQPTMGVNGSRLCMDKDFTRSVLAYANVLVTKGFSLLPTDTESHWEAVFNVLSQPVVVKQTRGTHGDGVFLNISDLEDFKVKVRQVFAEFELGPKGKVLVEEMLQGKEYRIIATRKKMLAVIYRRPASVTGDGSHTIKELIDIKNQEPIRNVSQDVYPHISIDEAMVGYLHTQGLILESVPAQDETVQLRIQSNIMAGGDAFDMTDEIHPSVAELAIAAVRAIPNLPFGGIDFMTTDITADQRQQQHAVIEVNSAPEFAMHDLPMYGTTRGVARAFLQQMFPELTSREFGSHYGLVGN